VTSAPERFLLAATARCQVAQVARALGARGIAMAPMKSTLLSATVYGRRARRNFSDVDVLVARDDFAAARRTLMDLGYRPWPGSWGGHIIGLAHPDRAFPIDLHGTLFKYGLFRLDADAVLSRARLDRDVFGVAVYLLDSRDSYALAIGNIVKDRLGTSEKVRELSDIARASNLTPESVADHLQRHGLARAARLVLADANEPHARAVLSALARDPTGALLAAAARRWLDLIPTGNALAAPATHLVNETAARGVRSFATHFAQWCRRAPADRPFNRSGRSTQYQLS